MNKKETKVFLYRKDGTLVKPNEKVVVPKDIQDRLHDFLKKKEEV